MRVCVCVGAYVRFWEMELRGAVKTRSELSGALQLHQLTVVFDGACECGTCMRGWWEQFV